VTFREVCIQAADGIRQESRREVLIPRRHPQILMPEQLRHGVNVGTFHAQPTCRGVAQVVKVKVLDLELAAQTGESNAHPFRLKLRKQRSAGLCFFGDRLRRRKPHGTRGRRLSMPVVVFYARLNLCDGLVDNPYRIRPVSALVM